MGSGSHLTATKNSPKYMIIREERDNMKSFFVYEKQHRKFLWWEWWKYNRLTLGHWDRFGFRSDAEKALDKYKKEVYEHKRKLQARHL